MKALVYRDFSESYEEKEIEAGKIRDVLGGYCNDRYAVIVNGTRRADDYEIRDGDAVIVRAVPHLTGLVIASLVVAGTAAVIGGVAAYKAKKQAQRAKEEAEKLAESLKNSGGSVDADPTMPGASNTVATGKTQPFVMGRRLWTPYFLADEWDEMRGTYWQEAVSEVLSAEVTFTVTCGSAMYDSCGVIYNAFSNVEISLKFLADWGGGKDIEIQYGRSKAGCRFTLAKGESRKAGETVSAEFSDVRYEYDYIYIDGEKFRFDVSFSKRPSSSSIKISKSITIIGAHYEKDSTERNYRVLQAGFADQAIEEIRADDEVLVKFNPPATSADTIVSSNLFPDSRIEIRENGEPFANEKFGWKMDVQETGTELKLADDESYADLDYTLPVNTKAVYIPLEFPQGLYDTNDDGSRKNRTIKTLVQYSTDGGETYGKLGTQFGKDGAIEMNARTDLYFILDHTFTDAEVVQAVKTSTPIKIKISCLTSKADNACDSMQIVKIRSRLIDEKKARKNGVVEYAPLLDAKIDALSVKIGLCLKATATNKDKAGKIQIVTCGMARVWDKTSREWSEEKKATRNPASWLLEVLTSRTHPASKLSDDEIDLESLGDFYEYCDENALNIDLVISTGDTKENILKKILETGNAGLYRSIYGKLAVAIDDKKTNAVAILNQQNLISFSAEKKLTRNVDGYRVTFTESGYWKEDTQVFMRDGSDYADSPADVQIEELKVDSFTADSEKGDFSQVYKSIRRKINADILRAHTFTLEIGKEGYFFPLFSKIKIQHPALYTGLGSSTVKRLIVSDKKIIALELYSPVQYSAGERYGAVIQCVNKNYSRILNAEYTAESGESTVINLVNPIPVSAETVPSADNILSFGLLSDDGSFQTITSEMTVTEISPTTSGYKLTGVDYSDALFDYGNIPRYRCNLSKPRGSLGTQPLTNDDLLKKTDEIKGELEKLVENSIVSSEDTPLAPLVEATAGKDGIQIACTPQGVSLSNTVKSYRAVIYRGADDTDGIEISSASPSLTYTFRRSTDGYPEADDLIGWRVKAKAVSIYGNESEWSGEAAADVSSYGTWKAPPVSVSYLTAGKDGLKAGWTANPSLTYGDVRYSVSFLYDGKEVRRISAAMQTQAEYTFDRDSDKDGYPEKAAVNAKLAELGIETRGRSVELYSVQVSAYTLQKQDDKQTNEMKCNASGYGTWVPGSNSRLTARASQDGITAEMETLPGSAEYGTPYRYEFGVRKSADGEWETAASDSPLLTRLFSGEYPEADELLDWSVRCRAVSVCGIPALSYRETSPDTTGYGTWKLGKPSVATRVSDRTITLVMSLPAKSIEQYGTVRYRVQIRRPEDDAAEEWFKPGLNLDPYADEGNYKDGDGYIETGSVYVQTMPLKEQSSKSLRDTQYQFRVTAVNEAHESEANSDVFATALCTSIRDIVKANETAKQAYISELSAISANIGTIKEGSLSGNDRNYWNLSTFLDESAGIKRWQGAMRVGGDDQYLKVEPVIENGEISGYDITFKVGNFEISSTASNINGELVIMRSAEALDRTRITPDGTFYEHRETASSAWAAVSQMTTAGILTSAAISDRSLIVTNMGIEERRLLGHDIGRPYLSDSSRVWHFDTDLNDQNQQSDIEIASYGEVSLVGSDTRGGIDYTPAILAVAPYSETAKSLFGQYQLKKSIEATSTLTVDFWMQYIWCEDQILFDIGTVNDRVRLAVANRQPYWNEPGDGEPPWNQEQTEQGDVVVWNEPGDASTAISHYGKSNMSPDADNIRTFSQLGISFEPNTWLHIGIILTADKISVFINKTGISFVRYEKAEADIDLTLNVDGDTLKNTFILDELMIDTKTAESLDDFARNTDARIPWGALASTEKHFILDAEGLETNIFESEKIKALEKRIKTLEDKTL